MKIFEEGTISGNATGKGGGASLPFNKGYYQSGNSGEPGITFTPTGEDTVKTYKMMKHSKKNMKKKKMKHLKKFEDANATAGNTGGMGNIVSAIPSSTPGDIAGSTPGSGDIGHSFGTFIKSAPNLKKKNKKMKKLQTFSNFVKEEIDNFTARYYDNYDDEEPAANEDDLQEFSPKNKKIQMYEKLIDHYTFECSGSPSPTFKTKAEFFDFMENHGFKHTTLTKNTDILIAADEDLGTLKCKKAEKYGIPIYSYNDAFKRKEMLYTKTMRKKRLQNLSNIAEKD